MAENLVPSPNFSDLTQKVSQAVSRPVGEKVQEGIQAIKTTAPQVKEEIKSYTQNYNPTLSHLIFLGFFLGVFLTAIFRHYGFNDLTNLVFWLRQLLGLAGWIGGGILGWNLLLLDNFLYLYFTHPQDSQTLVAKTVFSQKGFLAWVKFIINLKLKEKLAFRSALFQLVWVVLAFFSLTSTAGFFGKGVVIGLGLHLLIEQWQWQLKTPQELNQRLFWQIKRPVSLEEQKWYLRVITGIFFFLTILV